jgi:uncharacterized membrane protein YqjE
MDDTDRDMIQDAVKRLPSELRMMLEKRLELMALDISEGVSVIMSRLMFIIFGGIVLGIAILFTLMSLSYFIGELIDNTALGYFITALPLLIIGAMLFNKRPRSLYMRTKSWMLHQFIDLLSKKKLD